MPSLLVELNYLLIYSRNVKVLLLATLQVILFLPLYVIGWKRELPPFGGANDDRIVLLLDRLQPFSPF